MSTSARATPEDAGDAPPPSTLSQPSAPPPTRNAFTALMIPKLRTPVPPPPSKPALSNLHDRKDGLYAYMQDPTAHPPSRVIYHNAAFVAIHDAYPKATVHALLIPRDEAKTRLHPFDALADPAFLASVRAEAETLKALAASELRRLLGRYSASEQARIEAMDAEPPLDVLPPGRDWGEEIRVGVHAGPSMNHLHVHVLSREMHSVCVKHRKHYNSFNTPFFVPLEDFPLREGDERWDWGRLSYMKRGFVCWRCGAEFGSRFQALKKHLEEEFLRWRAE